MAEAQRYGAVVIGAGQGGVPLAKAFAAAGRRTALIERGDVGGTCVNVGCTPTKTMVASAKVAELTRRSTEYGVRAGAVRVDLAAVRDRKRAIVERFRSGVDQGIGETDGLDLFRGEARFTGPTALVVAMSAGDAEGASPAGEIAVESDLIVINTGGRPAMPALPGLDEVAALDSTTVMELAEVPDHLLVLGGGYVGLEFAQMFRRFGSRVSVVQRGPRLLGREDADVADAMAALLREDGIEVWLGTEADRAEAAGDGVRLFVHDADGERVVSGSHLLVASGRTPNTERLNLDAASVARDDRGYVRVDERLRTTTPGIWAMGDVTGGPAFTHVSYDDYRIVEANVADGQARTTTDRLVPYVVFTDPQLGRVGPTAEELRRRGTRFRVATMPMDHVARAIETGETRGFMKAIVGDDDQILSCAMLGIDGGELMAMVQIAMLGRLPFTALRDGVFAHPTLAEALNNLFATLEA